MDKLKQLFENANLPTDFANKASVLFEASMNEAVEARVKAEVQKIQEAAEANLEKEKESWIKESEEDVEKFLEKNVNEWAAANAAALTGSLKAGIAESILAKFKAVLEAEGIEMPDEKEGALKEAEEEIEKLKEELEDKDKELKEAKAQIVAFTKSQIVSEATKGLSRVAAGRIASLSENINFKNVRQFAGAVASITEGVTGKRLKLKEDAAPASKFPATNDNSNAAGADKDKAAVDVTEDADPASKFPATTDNSNAAGADKDKAAVEVNESDDDNKFFESEDQDGDADKDKDLKEKKGLKEDAGVDTKEVNADGSGDPSQEPAKVNESFDIVALTLKSLGK